jgi:hypothetical protein
METDIPIRDLVSYVIRIDKEMYEDPKIRNLPDEAPAYFQVRMPYYLWKYRVIKDAGGL